MEEPDITEEVKQQVLEYLKDTPKALGVLVMSFFSGHLWLFVVTAFLRSKNRGNQHLESIPGRTALGLLWFAAVLIPVYWLKFKRYDFDYERIMQVAIPTVVVGMFVQLIVFTLFAARGDGK